MDVLTNVNLNQNELQNAVMHPLAADPSSPKLGQVYYNSTRNMLRIYKGATIGWEDIGIVYVLPIASSATLGGVKVGQNEGIAIANDGKISLVISGDILTGASLRYSGDTVTLIKGLIDARTGETESDSEVIRLATASEAGLMSPSDVQAIEDLDDRVSALEGTTVRLLYDTKTNPTAAEISAFVQAQGYTDPTKWAGIAVVVAGTYHIWHYYTNNTAWRDDGADTVNAFTNASPGVIKGSATDGKVYAENDGTGSVYGWDALKQRVSDVEDDVADIPIVKTRGSYINTGYTTTGEIVLSDATTILATWARDHVDGTMVLVDVEINDVVGGGISVEFKTSASPDHRIDCAIAYI